MPPKPFKPPRPSANSKPTAKGPRKSTGKTNSAVSKSKPRPKSKSTSNHRSISSPRPPHLPSLSPDPSASAHSQDDDEDDKTNSRSEPESEPESNHNSDSSSLPSQPSLPKNPPPRRRKSHNAAAPLNIPSSSLDTHDNNNTQDSEAILSSRTEHIPAPLLSALLHTFLAEQGHAGTRIKKDANAAVGKYVDTFVREAIARAAWVREEGGDGEAGADRFGGDRGFLEVEDLERLAPQLLMDF